MYQRNQYNTYKQCLEKKFGDVDKEIPGISGRVTTTALNVKIGEVENKIPDLSGLVKKTDTNAKTSGIETKYSTSDYNKFNVKYLIQH